MLFRYTISTIQWWQISIHPIGVTVVAARLLWALKISHMQFAFVMRIDGVEMHYGTKPLSAARVLFTTADVGTFSYKPGI